MKTRIGYLTVKKYRGVWGVFHGNEVLEMHQYRLEALRAAREIQS